MPTALVTGGSQGFGLAVVDALAGQGWTVVTDARRADRLTAATAPLGAGVVAVPGDITDPAHVDALAAAVERTGRLDLLVNNASTLGPTRLRPVADLSPADLRQTFDVNVAAPLALLQRFLPQLRAAGGAVVNITSDAAVEGYETWAGY